MVLEMFQTQTRNLLEEMFFQKHELMQVVYYCLWETWDPARFKPDYRTRKLRNEAFCWENLGKTPNTKERSKHYTRSAQKALPT